VSTKPGQVHLEIAHNSGATINRKLAALSKMFTVAREKRWIAESDRPLMKRRKEGNRREYVVSHEEEDVIVSAYRGWGMTDMADLVVVLADTGARPWKEIPHGLEWPAVNFKATTLTIFGRKSPTGGIVNTTLPMTPRVAEILERRRMAGPDKPFACFTTYRRMNVQWEKLRAHMGKAADPGFTLYAFRHTCGVRLAEAGHTLIEIANWLGHSRTSTTERYARHMTSNSLARLADSLAKQTEEHRRRLHGLDGGSGARHPVTST
jgi:integrase